MNHRARSQGPSGLLLLAPFALFFHFDYACYASEGHLRVFMSVSSLR